MPQRVSLLFMNTPRGFSLIELMIVVVVITTAVSVSIPKLSERDATYRLEIATRRVQEDLEHARRTARFESRGVSITFDPVVASYYTWIGQPADVLPPTQPTLGGVDLDVLYSGEVEDTTIDHVVSVSANTRVAYSASGLVLARQVDLGGHPFKAALLASEFNSTPTLTFDGFGTPVSGGSVFVGVRSRGREISVQPDSGKIIVRTLAPLEVTTMKTDLATAQDADPGRDWLDLLVHGSGTVDGWAAGDAGGGGDIVILEGGGK